MFRVYLLAGALAAAIVGAGALYAKGRIDAANAARFETTMKALQERIEMDSRLAAALKADRDRAKAYIEQMQVMEETIDDLSAYADALEDRAALCLSSRDVERLRQQWGHVPRPRPDAPAGPGGN